MSGAYPACGDVSPATTATGTSRSAGIRSADGSAARASSAVARGGS